MVRNNGHMVKWSNAEDHQTILLDHPTIFPLHPLCRYPLSCNPSLAV
jgi:hypothetical protein